MLSSFPFIDGLASRPRLTEEALLFFFADGDLARLVVSRSQCFN